MKAIEYRYGTDENGLYVLDNFRMGRELNRLYKMYVSSHRYPSELQMFRQKAHKVIKEVTRRAESCNCTLMYLLEGYADDRVIRSIV